MAATDGYVLGNTDAELKRLATQARLIDPMTRRFLVSAGIKEGATIKQANSQNNARHKQLDERGRIVPSTQVAPFRAYCS